MNPIDEAGAKVLEAFDAATREMSETDKVRAYLWVAAVCETCTKTTLREMLDEQEAAYARRRDLAERIQNLLPVAPEIVSTSVERYERDGVQYATAYGVTPSGEKVVMGRTMTVETVDPAYAEHVRARLLAHGFESWHDLHGKRAGKIGFHRPRLWGRDVRSSNVYIGICTAIGAGQDFSWLDKPTREEKQVLAEAKSACAEKQGRLNREWEDENDAQVQAIIERAKRCGFIAVRPHTQRRKEVVFLTREPRRGGLLNCAQARLSISLALIDGQDFDAIFKPREKDRRAWVDPQPPRWEHGCKHCKYLGRYDHLDKTPTGTFDLYFCSAGGIPTVLARYDGTLAGYLSGLGHTQCPSLHEAERRAIAAGLLPANE